jgi:hypothetical protein
LLASAVWIERDEFGGGERRESAFGAMTLLMISPLSLSLSLQHKLPTSNTDPGPRLSIAAAKGPPIRRPVDTHHANLTLNTSLSLCFTKMKDYTQNHTSLRQYLLTSTLIRLSFLALQINTTTHSSSILSAIVDIVDPLHSWSDDIIPSLLIRQLFILASDVIGAFCIYHIGHAVLESEQQEEECNLLEERQTKKDGSDLFIPGVLRPEWGWVFGLPSKEVKNDSKEKAADTTKSDMMDPPNNKSQIISLQQLPLIASTVYILNPISAMAAAHSVRGIWDMFLLISFYFATLSMEGATTSYYPTGGKCAFFLVLATLVDVAYGVFLIPILLWRGLWRDDDVIKSTSSGCHCDWKIVLGLFVAYYAGFQILILYATNGELIGRLMPNLAFVEIDASGSFSGPNIGLHW